MGLGSTGLWLKWPRGRWKTNATAPIERVRPPGTRKASSFGAYVVTGGVSRETNYEVLPPFRVLSYCLFAHEQKGIYLSTECCWVRFIETCTRYDVVVIKSGRIRMFTLPTHYLLDAIEMPCNVPDSPFLADKRSWNGLRLTNLIAAFHRNLHCLTPPSWWQSMTILS